jgi:hypothetical protein
MLSDLKKQYELEESMLLSKYFNGIKSFLNTKKDDMKFVCYTTAMIQVHTYSTKNWTKLYQLRYLYENRVPCTNEVCWKAHIILKLIVDKSLIAKNKLNNKYIKSKLGIIKMNKTPSVVNNVLLNETLKQFYIWRNIFQCCNENDLDSFKIF